MCQVETVQDLGHSGIDRFANDIVDAVLANPGDSFLAENCPDSPSLMSDVNSHLVKTSHRDVASDLA